MKEKWRRSEGGVKEEKKEEKEEKEENEKEKQKRRKRGKRKMQIICHRECCGTQNTTLLTQKWVENRFPLAEI